MSKGKKKYKNGARKFMKILFSGKIDKESLKLKDPLKVCWKNGHDFI